MPDDDKPAGAAAGTEEARTQEEAASQAGTDQEGLTDYWDDILGPHPETIERRLVRELGLPHPGTLTIATSRGHKIVSIGPKGEVSYGEGIKPDEAAEIFWTNMALKRVGMEQRLTDLAIMEAMLVRMGRADLNYERAQVAAERQGAGDHERAIAERAHMGLQSIVHQVMDVARGLASRAHHARQPGPAPEPPPQRRGDPDCATCHGEGTVLGDCGDSPNVWFDPCPTCRPDPNCPTCRGDGMIDQDGDIRGLWRAPCPTCRPALVPRVDPPPPET